MNDSSAPSPWQTTRFEIKVRLEPLDLLHYMQVLRWTKLERVVSMLPPFSVACFTALGALTLSDLFIVDQLPAYPYWDWNIVIALATAAVASLVFKVFVMGPFVDSTFAGQPIGMGETTVVADERGIVSTSAGVTTQVPWSIVQSVMAKDEHMFLMFSRLMGIIVPKRGFADEAEATRFADFVRARAPAAAYKE